MNLYGKIDAATNYLRDLRYAVAPDADDVPLAAMPSGMGPWTYDAANQVAVPVDPKTARQTAAQNQVSAIPADVTITELKAVVMLTMDELNLLRKRLTDQDSAVAAATSLADLKSRWATVASADPMPQRTPAQVETALQNRITSTDVG